MKRWRIVAAAGFAAGLLSGDAPRAGADDKTLLILFDPRSGALPGALNDSGTMIVGGFPEGRAFYWMPTTGVVEIGGLQASGVSADGATIVGEATDARLIQNAAIWLRGTEWRLLGSFPNAVPCDKNLSTATGTSRDGKVVVGIASNGCKLSHAFRWTESTGMADLGSAAPDRYSRGLGVSGNGAVVVGGQEHETGFRQAARWVDGREEVLVGPTGLLGEARAANFDGSIVVGRQCRPADRFDQSAWILTPANGVQCLAAPGRRVSDLQPITEASGTSDDGRVIGGSQSAGGTGDSEAVIWIDRAPAYLKDFLRANGVPDAFDRWINTGQITAVSADGRMLLGYGAPIGGFRGYMVILGSHVVMP